MSGPSKIPVLCPRALKVLKYQLRLRKEFVQAGKIQHDYVCFQASGEPIRLLNYPYERWRHTMFRVYTAWAEGAIDSDTQAIQRAMKRRPAPLRQDVSP